MEGGNAEMAQLSATYGLPIGTWCVSKIQDFSLLFNGAASFNFDISLWDSQRVPQGYVLIEAGCVVNEFCFAIQCNN
jgi:hypothetical protein